MSSITPIDVGTQETDQYTELFRVFANRYRQLYPPPIQGKAESTDWLTIVFLLIVVASSLVVSGSRTIEEFGGGAVGFFGFIMCEIGGIGFGFVYALRFMTDKTKNAVKYFILANWLLLFLTMIAANIHAVLTHANGGTETDNINGLVNLLLSISAPLSIFLSGDVLGIEFIIRRRNRLKVIEAHSAAMQEYSDKLAEAWKRTPAARKLSNFQISNVSDDSISNGISIGNSIGNVPVISARSTAGHRKHRDASERVRKFYEDTPEALAWPVAQIIGHLGDVEKSTVYAVRKQVQAARQSENAES